MLSDQFIVTSVDHPSLNGRFGVFLDELRSERGCTGRASGHARTPCPELIDRLAEPKMMRLGVMHLRRLVAVAAVDNDGAVALAVVEEFRRRDIANELLRVLEERAAAIGYPPLHRDTAGRARLAG